MAAGVLNDGQLVGFATETVYGIAALATNEHAMARLRDLKSRPRRPFTVHLARPDDVGRYVRKLPGAARRLIDATWPGPVTLLAPTGGKLATREMNVPEVRAAVCSKTLIGLRCPDEPVATAMLAAVDGPVVAPSANLIGAPSPRTAEEVLEGLEGRIDLLIDSGHTRLGTDSTIVTFEHGAWSVVRRAAVGDEQLAEAMGRTIVFVCTGNSCRSPMAAGLAEVMLAERLHCEVVDLAGQGIEVISAGVFAGAGSPATPEAINAVTKYGVDITAHASQPLTKELINSADVICCMTQTHVNDVCRQAPSAADKTRRLDPDGDITDPLGGGIGVYRKTASHIRRALRAMLEETVL
ncbi:MAG: L-threonylcarbamoyladenylate synthase [Planctomycetota bacterium]|jgi:protein-tyrosine phosphatase